MTQLTSEVLFLQFNSYVVNSLSAEITFANGNCRGCYNYSCCLVRERPVTITVVGTCVIGIIEGVTIVTPKCQRRSHGVVRVILEPIDREGEAVTLCG